MSAIVIVIRNILCTLGNISPFRRNYNGKRQLISKEIYIMSSNNGTVNAEKITKNGENEFFL